MGGSDHNIRSPRRLSRAALHGVADCRTLALASTGAVVFALAGARRLATSRAAMMWPAPTAG